MVYGFKVINSGNVLQISDLQQTYVLTQKVTVTTVQSGGTLYGPTYMYMARVTVYASNQSFFAFRSNTPNVPCSIHNLHTANGTWQLLACSGGNVNQAASVTIYVLEPIGGTALAAERYGMRVFDAAGKVVFSTGKSLCRFQDWRNYSGMNDNVFAAGSFSYPKRPAVLPVQYPEVWRCLNGGGGMSMLFSEVAAFSFSGNTINAGSRVDYASLGVFQNGPPLGAQGTIRTQAMFAVVDASKW